MLSGASVRYRFYTRWGLSGEELSRIVFSYSVTFWLGLLALGGVSLAAQPGARRAAGIAGGRADRLAAARRACVAYRGGAAGRAGPRVGPTAFRCRGEHRVSRSWCSRSVDWALAGAVLYVLLPAGSVPFLAFLGAFLAAILVGMASHVPGGLGVFDGLLVVLLKPYLHPATCCRRWSCTARCITSCPSRSRWSGCSIDELRQRRAQARPRDGCWSAA